MADKVSWIFFYIKLKKHILESQLAEMQREGKNCSHTNVIIKYLCCKQMPNALSDSIIKYYTKENANILYLKIWN